MRNPFLSHISVDQEGEPGDKLVTICGKTRTMLGDDEKNRRFVCGPCWRGYNELTALDWAILEAQRREASERLRAIRAMAGPGTFISEDGINQYRPDDEVVGAAPWVDLVDRDD